jgi:hypothetical protein
MFDGFNIVSGIVERNPKKFKIDDVELSDRRAFVERTKTCVKVIIIPVFMYINLMQVVLPPKAEHRESVHYIWLKFLVDDSLEICLD